MNVNTLLSNIDPASFPAPQYDRYSDFDLILILALIQLKKENLRIYFLAFLAHMTLV